MLTTIKGFSTRFETGDFEKEIRYTLDKMSVAGTIKKHEIIYPKGPFMYGLLLVIDINVTTEQLKTILCDCFSDYDIS